MAEGSDRPMPWPRIGRPMPLSVGIASRGVEEARALVGPEVVPQPVGHHLDEVDEVTELGHDFGAGGIPQEADARLGHRSASTAAPTFSRSTRITCSKLVSQITSMVPDMHVQPVRSMMTLLDELLVDRGDVLGGQAAGVDDVDGAPCRP